jgi:hypothetical protein
MAWFRRAPAVPPPAPVRPLPRLARDVDRLACAFHREGLRFAKYEGVRLAYDRALGELCDVLEVPHLLAVLAAGPELDVERARVECLLRPLGWLPGRVGA